VGVVTVTTTYTSARTCRPCQGTGVGAGWGEACPACAGSGEAAPDAPVRLRRSRVHESEAATPGEAELDRLANLIDACDHRLPEVEYASAAIGRTDLTADQCAALIAALEPLVPPPPSAHRRLSGHLSTDEWLARFERSMTDLRAVQASHRRP
jgi:hypothetical protein